MILTQIPISSSQLDEVIVAKEQTADSPNLVDLQDISYIIMSPSAPDKEDLRLDMLDQIYP